MNQAVAKLTMLLNTEKDTTGWLKDSFKMRNAFFSFRYLHKFPYDLFSKWRRRRESFIRINCKSTELFPLYCEYFPVDQRLLSNRTCTVASLVDFINVRVVDDFHRLLVWRRIDNKLLEFLFSFSPYL